MTLSVEIFYFIFYSNRVNQLIAYFLLPGNFRKRIIKHLSDEEEAIMMAEKYKFLLIQFKSHKISFDPQVYGYIWLFGQKLLSRVRDHNEYQTRMVYNLIGRWLFFVEKIENNGRKSAGSPLRRNSKRSLMACLSQTLKEDQHF